MTATSSAEVHRIVSADLSPESILQRSDDPPTVRVVLRVGAGNHEYVEGQAQDVAADLDVALLHHVEHRHLDPLGEVGQLVDGNDAAMRARDQAEVDGLRITQTPPLGHLDGVDIADQVGDRCVRRRQLLGVPLVAVAPLNRQLVAEFRGATPRCRRDRIERVLPQFRAGDHRSPLVQQPHQRTQQPGLALPALTEEYDVVPGDQRALDLRNHGVGEPVQSWPRDHSRRKVGQQVVADLNA